MAKLFFRYSSMGAGKSLDLLKTAFNYEEHGKKVLIFTSAKDDRFGENKVKSRTGLEKPAIGVSDGMDLFEYVIDYKKPIDCVLVDEVQFFRKWHIRQLADIVDKLDIPVIAYGLRSDFRTEPFEGSTYMLILADQIEELKTLCHNCNKKAILNIRYSIKEGSYGHAKKILFEGEQVQIGGNECYMPLCRKCYKELLDINEKMEVKDTSIIPEGMYCYTGIKMEKGVYYTKLCPYWDAIKDVDEQECGYCHYLEEGDSYLNDTMILCDEKTGEKSTPNEIGIPGGLLWDQVKECGINYGDDDE